MHVKVGTYTGNATDNRSITGVGFQPDFVYIKGGSTEAVARFTSNGAGNSLGMATGVAEFADGIQAFETDGFQIGTDSRVNTNAVVYYYLAIEDNGDTDVKIGSYTGNGSDNHDITGIGFQPDMVMIKQIDGTGTPVFRTSSHTGDDTSRMPANANFADGIQSFGADGWQVGTNARVNTNGGTYAYLAVKNVTGEFIVGTYTGNNTDNRDITGLGFTPDAVMVKGNSATAPIFRNSSMSGDTAGPNTAAAFLANAIQSFASGSFQVGTDTSTNANTVAFYWFAFANVAPAGTTTSTTTTTSTSSSTSTTTTSTSSSSTTSTSTSTSTTTTSTSSTTSTSTSSSTTTTSTSSSTTTTTSTSSSTTTTSTSSSTTTTTSTSSSTTTTSTSSTTSTSTSSSTTTTSTSTSSTTSTSSSTTTTSTSSSSTTSTSSSTTTTSTTTTSTSSSTTVSTSTSTSSSTTTTTSTSSSTSSSTSTSTTTTWPYKFEVYNPPTALSFDVEPDVDVTSKSFSIDSGTK